MKTLKIALAAAILAASAGTVYAGGLTDADPQMVNIKALQNDYVVPTPAKPLKQAQGSGNTVER